MDQSTQKIAPEGKSISFKEALLFWLKLGFISFGGPAGQIAIMHHELVEKKRWISEKRFMHALNYCMVLPGPEAQQLATYIGWLMHRTWGGVIAGCLFVLPSLFILIALSFIYVAFGHIGIVAGFLYGIKPAVVAIVLQATHRIGSRALKNQFLWVIATLSFLAIFIWNIPFPAIVVVAALIGSIAGRWAPAQFTSTAHHAQKTYGAAIIDDGTVITHTQFTWLKLAAVLLTGVLLWLLPMMTLYYLVGWQHIFTQMAWFFTKAALLTFGGAYAVLPYVYQGSVLHYGWLTSTQMVDGLALGEATPGPLIMVVAFVGFVGAYTQSALGIEAKFIAGAVAACIVTWFTFLPSFIFILAGGPLVEKTHNEIKLTTPLVSITAAVVGVILNLALFFAYHVFWPQGFAGSPDLFALLIAACAIVALFKYRIGVIKILLMCGLFGVLKILAPL